MVPREGDEFSVTLGTAPLCLGWGWLGSAVAAEFEELRWVDVWTWLMARQQGC